MEDRRRLGDAGRRLPVTVLTGFLGSGKTTLLNRLLRAPEMAGTLVIVNEFGEVGLDHLLIETPADETILLNNGCLCCAVLGDLMLTLARLVERRRAGELPPFQRVVVETTGLADPAPLLHTVLADPEISAAYELDTVVTVVDCVNGGGQLDRHFEAVKQAAVADRLVLSKADLADEGAVSALSARLRRMNPGATPHVAVKGDIAAAELVGGERAGRDWSAWLGETPGRKAASDTVHRDRHRHDDGIRTFTLRRQGPVSRDGLRLWLNALARFRGPNLLRVKGLVDVEGEPVLVQAVQHLFHEPETLPEWPDGDATTRIVFIVHDLERAEVEATLAALDFAPPSGRVEALSFDGADYGRFVEALRNFGPMDRL